MGSWSSRWEKYRNKFQWSRCWSRCYWSICSLRYRRGREKQRCMWGMVLRKVHMLRLLHCFLYNKELMSTFVGICCFRDKLVHLGWRYRILCNKLRCIDTINKELSIFDKSKWPYQQNNLWDILQNSHNYPGTRSSNDNLNKNFHSCNSSIGWHNQYK